MVKLETVAARSSEDGRSSEEQKFRFFRFSPNGKNCPKSEKKGVKIVSKIFFLDR